MADSHKTRPRAPRDLLEAVRDTVRDFGVDDLASMTATSPGVIYNKANPNESSHHTPTLADAVIWPQITGDDRIPRAYCRAVGGVFVSLKGMSEQSDAALLDLLLKHEEALGQFAKVMHDGLDDGRVTPDEFAEMEQAASAAVSAFLTLVRRLEGMSHA